MSSLAPRRGGFPKGVSGNPGGRLAPSKAVRDLARRYTVEAVAKLVSKMRNGSSDTIQVNAAVELLVWGYGRPAPIVPVSEETGPVRVQFVEHWRDPESGQVQGRAQSPGLKPLAASNANGLQPPGPQKPVGEAPYRGFIVR